MCSRKMEFAYIFVVFTRGNRFTQGHLARLSGRINFNNSSSNDSYLLSLGFQKFHLVFAS